MLGGVSVHVGVGDGVVGIGVGVDVGVGDGEADGLTDGDGAGVVGIGVGVDVGVGVVASGSCVTVTDFDKVPALTVTLVLRVEAPVFADAESISVESLYV